MEVSDNRHILERKAAAKLELLRRAIKKGDFWSYCLYWDYRFFVKRPFLKDIARILQRVFDAYKNGEVIRAAISLPPRAGKCVHPDTIIYTPFAPIKIKDIEVGQPVVSYNDGERCIETVVSISKSIKKQVKISYATGEYIITSPEHRLLTDVGYLQAKDISTGNFLIEYLFGSKNEYYQQCPLSHNSMADFRFTTISAIEYIDEEIEMYDIQTTGVNNFVANGIVSHNSYIVSLFCAFMLGHFPDKSIMRNTCTSTLYEKLSKDVREMVSSEKWFRLFGILLRTKGVKTWDLETATQSSYFGGGTGGTIIGIGASMLDISDDLYRGITDALSETVNKKTIDWAEGARGSRAELGCCTIDVGTRWRIDDIIGINERRGDYLPENVIKVSALDKNDKSFCENVQSTEHYLEERSKIAEAIWLAEYQQEPIDIKGRLFDYDDLMWYNGKLPEDVSVDANIGVCDVADEGHDYLSAPFAKKIGDLYYIYDWVFTTESVETTQPLLVGTLNEERVNLMRFESNNGGRIFALDISKEVETTVTWQFTTSNKETRIFTDSAWIKKHCVFRNNTKPGSQYDRALQQVLSYLARVEKQKDDAPDSLSMMRRFTDELGFNYVEVKKAEGRTEWVSIPIGINQINV